ncbi:hypothetical protein [Metabacillus fastidiosus]|uniref:hypothetical protein n=1 Tax=Metabacillus fastidiosus TaxID=1458 RepID=UPI003D2B9944
MTIIGVTPFGFTNTFKTYTSPVRNIEYVELNGAIYDELHIREKTDGVDTSNVKDPWQIDTIILAKFMNDLEAGNINNQGVKIDKFAIKRKRINEINPITLGYKDFVNNNQFVYQDFTQPRGEFIYSIVPIGENGLEGQENSITIDVDFAGFHLVDKDTNEVLSFDTFIGSEPTVTQSLNQGRTQIDTFSKYPSFYYTEQNYHSFSLQAVFIPEEWESAGKKYEDILNQFVYSHKPFIIKGGNGSIYVADIHTPSVETPMNAYRERDYMTLTLQCTEVMNYKDYIEL